MVDAAQSHPHLTRFNAKKAADEPTVLRHRGPIRVPKDYPERSHFWILGRFRWLDPSV